MDVLYFDLGDELRFPQNQLTARIKAKKNIYCNGFQVWLQKNVKEKKFKNTVSQISLQIHWIRFI